MRNVFMTTNCFSPKYYDKFKCIAAACPDSCCRSGWEIPLDDDTFEFYKGFQDLEIEKNVEKGTDGDRIFKLKRNKECVCLDENGLCRLYTATNGRLGEICHKYPRFFEEYDGFIETGISVSCPEARAFVLSAAEDDYSSIYNLSSDDELLSFLIRSRKTALSLVFSSQTADEAANKLISLGLLLQDSIDFGDLLDVDEELLNGVDPDGAADIGDFCRLILDKTEILYPEWRSAVLALSRGKAIECAVSESEKRAYLAYLVYRFFLKAINTEDVLSVCEFIYLSFSLVTHLSCGFDMAVGLFSKEIEHDDVNIETILSWIAELKL